MKIFDRIFITLLIVAVLVSSMAVSTFASEPEGSAGETEEEVKPEYTLQDYVNLLEYFDEDVLFGYDFTGDTVDYSASLVKNTDGDRSDRVVGVQQDGFLSLTIKGREGNPRAYAYSDLNTYLGWTSETAIGSFNADFKVCGSSNPGEEFDVGNLPKIVVVVGDAGLGNAADAATHGTTIASIDYRGGYFTYLKSVDDGLGGKKGIQYVTNFAITADSWYTVSLTYDRIAGKVSITVTDATDETKTITVSDGYVPYNEIRDVRIGAHGDDLGTARGTVMSFAYARVLGGIYHRDVLNMQNDIEEKLLCMYEAVKNEETDHELRMDICDVASKIKGNGFTSELEDVQAALDVIGFTGVQYYVNLINECLTGNTELPTYADRREYVDSVLVYADALDIHDFSTETEEDILLAYDALVAIYALDDELVRIEEHTKEFIAEIDKSRKDDLSNYPKLVEYVAKFGEYDPDLTYEGAADAYDFYLQLCASAEAMDQNVELFIEHLGIANDAELDINTRVASFRTLKDNFFGNRTYPGFSEYLDLYLDEVEPYFNDVIFNSESFIRYVEKADYSPYVTAKQSNLDVALGYMDLAHPEFEGVAEAKLLYVEVQEYIDAQIANANAYIAAVNKLDTLGLEELLATIDSVKELKKIGDVNGVAGVIEANIKFDEILASLELGDRYCIHFIALVNSLDNASTTAERYKIFAAAKKAQKDVVDTYEGVLEAIEKLDNAIEAYNNDVASVNEEFDRASEVAAYTAGAGKGSNYVSVHIVALVKKIFTEE